MHMWCKTRAHSVRARIGIDDEEICRQHCMVSGSVIEVSEMSGSTNVGGCEVGFSEARLSRVRGWRA